MALAWATLVAVVATQAGLDRRQPAPIETLALGSAAAATPQPGYLVAGRGVLSSATDAVTPTPRGEEQTASSREASSRGERPRSVAPTATPTDEPKRVITYRVVDGDTIAGLAERFGISAETIVWANDLADGGALLQVGQELTIPPASGVMYTVQEGDTLLGIAGRYGVTSAAIVEANGLADPDALSPGQQMVIPGARPPAPTEAAPAPAEIPQEPPTPPTDGDKGRQIAAIAAQYVGYPYLYGGSSPATGFDCSGFTWYVCQQAGVEIPNHDLWGQLHTGAPVARDELLPGDLVFFANTYQAGLSHAGVYVGEGRFVHAATPAMGVRYDALDDAYWSPKFYGASRPW